MNVILMCPIIDLQLLLQRYVCEHHDLTGKLYQCTTLHNAAMHTHLKILDQIYSNLLPGLAPKIADGHISVQLRQSRKGCLCPRLSDILCAQEELERVFMSA